MAQKNIGAFDLVTTPALTDEHIIVQSAVTYNETNQQVLNTAASLTAKTTPVDADTMPLNDSAASNVAKKVTWANIKATLKAYFDGLYVPINTYIEFSNGSDVSFGTSENTWLNPSGHSISLTAGKWLVSYNINIYLAANSDGGYIQATFSTANNSESNNKYTSLVDIPALETYANISKTFIIDVATTTTYYLNGYANSYGIGLVAFTTYGNTAGDTLITAVKIG